MGAGRFITDGKEEVGAGRGQRGLPPWDPASSGLSQETRCVASPRQCEGPLGTGAESRDRDVPHT